MPESSNRFPRSSQLDRGARPPETFADYLVVAITPALIMILIGALVFFLISVFYTGEFELRLKYICGLFILAAVLIGRISIEEGSEYATMYAVPLALAILVAMSRFSDAGLIFNLLLIAVVWFSAHKLTWDCTVLDRDQDASGQGLLQTVGLDGDGRESDQKRNTTKDLDVVTESPEEEESDGKAADDPLRGLMQRWRDHRNRPHAPGVWVIYFCLASIPLFGVGQMLMRDGQDVRRKAFFYLCLYVAAGLALLCTTSFLSLRRYLRQRRLEMPVEMAITWSVFGVVMIGALLLFCLLLPRPNPEYSVSDWAPKWSSPISLKSSDWGFGKEGVKDREQANQEEQKQGQQGKEGKGPQGQGKTDATAKSGGKQSGGKQSGEKQSGEKQSGGKQSGGKQSGDKQSGDKQSGGKQSGDKQSGDKQSGDKQSGDKQSGGKQSGDKQSGNKQSGDKQSGDKQSGDKQSGDKQSGDKQSGDMQAPESERDPAKKQGAAQTPQKDASRNAQDQQPKANRSSASQRPAPATPPPAPRSSTPSKNWLSNLAAMLGSGFIGLLKLIYWIVIIGVLVFLGMRYRQQIQAAILQFIEDIKRLWERLFGGGKTPQPVASAESPSPPVAAELPSFGSFRNPFQSGDAQRMPTEQLIRYSFEAFEAWARDRQCPRTPEQTPAEFCRAAAQREGAVAAPARILADLYNLAAYSGNQLPADAKRRLQQFWSALQGGQAIHE